MKRLLCGIAMLVACGNSPNGSGSQDSSPSGQDTPRLGTGGSSGTETNAGGSAGTSIVPGGTGGAAGSSTSAPTTIVNTGGAVGGGGVIGTGNGGASGTAAGGSTASGGSTPAAGGKSGSGGTRADGGIGSGGASSPSGSGGAGLGGSGSGGKTGAGSGGAGDGGAVDWSSGPPETKPQGYGQGTTGGGSAATVDVNSMAALQAAIDAYSGSGGLNLRYTGKFNFSGISDPCTQHSLPAQIVEIKKKNDISIIGADGSAANFGIHIASSASNIIVRNMTFGFLPGGDASDIISIEGMSGGVPTNIWIDHNELFSALVACPGAGDVSFDGLIDLKKGADKVTVSYNYIHDHSKVSLNGFSDSDTEVRHITFHHNVFENVGSRTPLQRGGLSHVLSNYFHQVTTSGANIRMGGHSLIEANYFDTVKNPVTSRDSEAIGYWDLRNNNVGSPADFATYKITWSASDSTPTVDATDWKTTAAYPEALGYSYTADPPACVRAGLPSVAGAGKGLATLKCN